MTEARSSLLLVDGTGLLVRCGRAAPGRLQANGSPTGTLLLFINSMARLLRRYRAGHVLVAFDGPDARACRRKLVTRYKANRPDPPDTDSASYLLAAQFLDAARIARCCYRNYEADDVIAWALRQAGGTVAPVLIVSDDADLHQLITDGVSQAPLSGEAAGVLGYQEARARYGFSPRHLPQVKALAGDRSDNIPGVPGVGMKRAVQLLETAGWDLARVSHKAFLDRPQLKVEVFRYEEVMNLKDPALRIENEQGMDHFPIASVTSWDPAVTGSLPGFLDRYELASVLRRLEEGRLW